VAAKGTQGQRNSDPGDSNIVRAVARPADGRHWQKRRLRRLGQTPVARVVNRNVETITVHRQRAESARTFQQHLADWVTRFAGSMAFVYLHVVWFGVWIFVNLGVSEFDPSFSDLTMTVSLEAIFLSVFVLVSQNRQSELADRRAELDLQVNLLNEYETTRILKLVRKIAEHSSIQMDADPELDELIRDVDPEQLLRKIEKKSQS
jgi:uncharacterized membrane protein